MELKNTNSDFIFKNKDKINVIDVRTIEEYEERKYLYSKRIDLDDLIDFPNNHLDKNLEYYILCGSGNRATRVTSILVEKGYNCIVITGGIKSFPDSEVTLGKKATHSSCEF